ncbi:MAG TPA: PhnD/SsuA/transferrin family substrate-binding protein [Candidatus Dormibacteraeota bacterium]
MTGQRWATYLAPNVRPAYDLVARAVSRELGIEVALEQRSDYGRVARGEYDFAFLCGLPYVEMVDGMIAALVPVAAPVLFGPRHSGGPTYFSDVIVAAASRRQTFEDLRRCRWAYNEKGSHSGYLVILHRLARLGETTAFFGEWVDAGFHQEAIRKVVTGDVDASAIDSQVLAVALDIDPSLQDSVRVIDSLGPSTSQPLVAAGHVPDDVVRAVREVVLRVGLADEEREVMAAAHVERFAAVEDSDYDDIRRTLAQVQMAGLWTEPRPAGLSGP